MLTALRIADFATLEEAELTLGPGLTVLTGETGAGKSLLVDALGLLLGARAGSEVVRSGAEEASVEGLFSRAPALARRLAELGLPDLGEEVSIRRVIHRSGRGKVHVNGALITVGVLGQLMRGMFDIAGQLDSVSLFSPAEHRALLDRSGRVEGERAAYDQAYGQLRGLESRLETLGGSPADLAARAEFLTFQLQEFETLDPRPGEDAELELERRRLADAERLTRAASDCEGLLEAQDDSALELVARAEGLVREVRGSDPMLAPILERLGGLSAELEDVSRSLSRYARTVEVQPDRLRDVEDRLNELRRVCRKHGTDMAGLHARREALAAEREMLQRCEEVRAQLLAEHTVALERAQELAAQLSQARVRAGVVLSKAVTHAMASLAMPKARFEVVVQNEGTLGPEGGDIVQFLFTANAGEPLRPLVRVASGGEASRLLLALRRHLMESDDGLGCVLDEADAGVSGAVADQVGLLMREVSRRRQVLCITHLPQVAAHGDAHWVVDKREDGGRTRSRLTWLRDEESRAQELARMLSGREVTREALGAAQALVRSATAAAIRARPPRNAERARRTKLANGSESAMRLAPPDAVT